MLLAGAIGIISEYDVFVGELGCGADLAFEAADGIGVGEAFLANDLEGDVAVHAAMAGLEDLSHAAFAEFLEEDILIEKEFWALAFPEHFDLQNGEPIAFNDLLGEVIGGHAGPESPLGNLREIGLLDQFGLTDSLDEFSQASPTHSQTSIIRGWRVARVEKKAHSFANLYPQPRNPLDDNSKEGGSSPPWLRSPERPRRVACLQLCVDMRALIYLSQALGDMPHQDRRRGYEHGGEQ